MTTLMIPTALRLSCLIYSYPLRITSPHLAQSNQRKVRGEGNSAASSAPATEIALTRVICVDFCVNLSHIVASQIQCCRPRPPSLSSTSYSPMTRPLMHTPRHSRLLLRQSASIATFSPAHLSHSDSRSNRIRSGWWWYSRILTIRNIDQLPDRGTTSDFNIASFRWASNQTSVSLGTETQQILSGVSIPLTIPSRTLPTP